MPKRRVRRTSRGKSGESKERRGRTDRPTVMTAAGLLAFYEEEEAIIKIKPMHVMIIATALTAIVILLNIVLPLAPAS